MDYFSKYYENEQTLKELLDEYQEVLERVQYFGDLLKHKAIDTPADMQEAILELGGVFTAINAVAMSLESERKNRETYLAEEKRHNKMQGIEMSYLERVRLIGYIRKIEGIFTGSANSCGKIISIFQSNLKSIDKEKTVPYD